MATNTPFTPENTPGYGLDVTVDELPDVVSSDSAPNNGDIDEARGWKRKGGIGKPAGQNVEQAVHACRG